MESVVWTLWIASLHFRKCRDERIERDCNWLWERWDWTIKTNRHQWHNAMTSDCCICRETLCLEGQGMFRQNLGAKESDSLWLFLTTKLHHYVLSATHCHWPTSKEQIHSPPDPIVTQQHIHQAGQEYGWLQDGTRQNRCMTEGLLCLRVARFRVIDSHPLIPRELTEWPCLNKITENVQKAHIHWWPFFENQI